MTDYSTFDPPPPEPPPADPCHCGEPAVADCPCCEARVCAKHLSQAAQALAGAIGLKRQSKHHEGCPRFTHPDGPMTMVGCAGCDPGRKAPLLCMSNGCEKPAGGVGMFCVTCADDIAQYEDEQRERRP